jgi:hypothetical protein
LASLGFLPSDRLSDLSGLLLCYDGGLSLLLAAHPLLDPSGLPTYGSRRSGQSPLGGVCLAALETLCPSGHIMSTKKCTQVHRCVQIKITNLLMGCGERKKSAEADMTFDELRPRYDRRNLLVENTVRENHERRN